MNKYRNGTNRLKGFDYRASGCYFITICVRNRLPAFGEIVRNEMRLSELGKVAHEEWIKTAAIRRSMNLKLGEFIVMPDHFHAVVSIGENNFNQHTDKNQMGIQSQNIGAVVRGFKSVVTSYARQHGLLFEWQPRYYDRIIQSEKELIAVEQYIRDNVSNWERDR